MPNKISMLNRLKPVRKLVVLALLHLALLPVASAIACDAESMVTSLTLRHGIGARPVWCMAHFTINQQMN